MSPAALRSQPEPPFYCCFRRSHHFIVVFAGADLCYVSAPVLRLDSRLLTIENLSFYIWSRIWLRKCWIPEPFKNHSTPQRCSQDTNFFAFRRFLWKKNSEFSFQGLIHHKLSFIEMMIFCIRSNSPKQSFSFKNWLCPCWVSRS